MKILLVGNYLSDGQQSMLRFCGLLEGAMRNAGHAVRVIRPEARLSMIAPAAGELHKWLGYADKFVVFPARLRRAAKWADVVHVCDQAYSLYARHPGDVPTVVTCHDLIAAREACGEFPGYRTRLTGRSYQRMILAGLARATRVACDSEATRSDLLRLCRLPASRSSVVYLALNFPYSPASEAERTPRLARLGIAPGERFLVHVGGSTRCKNRPGVIRIFEAIVGAGESGLKLIMVSAPWDAQCSKLVKRSSLEGRVRSFSGVGDEDLRALYSGAAALLFPSLAEGFGWPIIEAQACGCPVFTSNRPPMTEVGGPAAVYIDPESPEEAARTIRERLRDTAETRELGFSNARRFSLDKMLAEYLNTYAAAIESHAVGRLVTAGQEAIQDGPPVPLADRGCVEPRS